VPGPARSSRILTSAALALVFLASPSPAAAAPDVGYEGPSYVGLTTSAPTGEKPESKLWFNDGSWWGSLFHSATGTYRIHRLDVPSQTWVNTGTLLDPRPNTKADTLWHAASGKLYVASHVMSSSGGSASTAESSRLYRYSYNTSTRTYSLDANFPVLINSAKSESLVIDRDSNGRLWATWVQGRQVYVNRTVCNPGCDDRSWGTPFVPNVNGVHPDSTSVSSDDISSIVAFGGSKVGLMWSNQSQSAVYFAVHDDSAGDTSWQASRTAIQGAGVADDHINLATLQADDGGRVYAVIKTSHSSSSAPLIMVLVRNPSTGNWASYVHSTKQYNQTRPILLIDETAARVHVFTSDTGGGGIYHKSTPISNISFTNGKGTLVMWDDSARDVNDATSTKQNVTSATGLVVLASNDTTSRYWHHYDPLGGTAPPPQPSAPVANFTATPTSGTAPLAVTFTDTSTNSPTSWAWDFDNNGSVDSTAQHPTHTYSSAGTYTVKLTASNSAGSNTVTKAGFITVGTSGGGGGTLIFVPVADAKTSQSSPTKNYGTTTDLRLRLTTKQSWNSYLKFDVTGLSGTVSSAKLRLYVTTGSPSGGRAHQVSNSWTESGITWNTAPALSGLPLSTLGSVAGGTWAEYDVTASVVGNGTLSLGLTTDSGSSVIYSSREGSNPPQLVVTTGGGTAPPPQPSAPVADFTATPTSGTAPLAVAFTDTSTNGPTSWAWDFDNNGSVDSTAQHPSHTYSAAGTYTVKLTVSNSAGSHTVTKTGFITVGAPPPQPSAPVADFTATPTSGTAPLAVAFTDTSTNGPTSWAWDFDNNGSVDSTAQHPSHTYSAAGTYTVKLTVSNSAGSHTVTKTGFITVGTSGGGGGTLTFTPIADAYVVQDKPNNNYGTATTLRVRFTSSQTHYAYLRFDVSGLASSVSSAKLRLYVTDPSWDGGSVYSVSSSWTESGITWSNAPAITGSPLGSTGAVATGAWVEVDVTSAVAGNGSVSFALRSGASDSALYSSREGSNPPQLVVTTGS
jgi:trimeric autotransporter adhesin